METKKRGCGTRKQGGLYACVGFSSHGRPIEDFLIDPPKPWPVGPFRAPMIVEGKDEVNDILIWVGAEFYPFVPDFIEEARVMGISRRLPRDFPVEKLSRKSRMFLVHPRVFPQFRYETGQKCPRGIEHEKYPYPEESPCVFDLWPLSALLSTGRHQVTWAGEAHNPTSTVTTPSVMYRIPVPSQWEEDKEDQYKPGVFASFWISHYDYINQKGRLPHELQERFERANLELHVEPE